MTARRTVIPDLWDETKSQTMSEAEQLLYRSNLLGADKRVTNFGGGNTSGKITMDDPLSGEAAEVLWVKGSGGDLGSMALDGFATLYMDKLRQLKELYRGPEHEDEMVGYLPHCTFNLNPRAASIDTPLHAYIPRKHVDHMHPDAVIAIAASENSRELTEQVFGDEMGWLPWQRPGYDLGLRLEEHVRENPHIVGIVLAGHGLFTWGDTAQECYRTTLRIIQRAQDWLDENNTAAAFGGERVASLPGEERRRVAAEIMPALRGRISVQEAKIGHFDDSEETLEFVNSRQLDELAALGTSCPDHFLRTKIRPLVLPLTPDNADVPVLLEGLDEQLADYRREYEAYYERCSSPDSPPLRDPNPVIYLVPGVGMLSFAKDKATARIASEFYRNAINVMRGANGVDRYVGLSEQEAFNIEYWQLEEAKLRRMPAPKPLAGQVALVTGAAGGIGRAVSERFLSQGACVLMVDIDDEALGEAESAAVGRHGGDRVRRVRTDLTDEQAVATAVRHAAQEFGGLDILVSNAGIASASPIEETSLALWEKNMSVLATGYFLVSREAFRLMKAQGTGGAITFVASKNGLVASGGASAYCTAKAAEIHLARCLALEGAPEGIRVNTVNPDAVIRGSRIWSGSWRTERAEANRISEDELEEHYRQRSLLKRSVLPEDVAEAVYFLVSSASAKSTGNIINVDAGHAAAFTR